MAVIEDGELVELRIERESRRVGSIYKGVVERVLPGMDSAFVDVGLARNAFAHVSDFVEGDLGEESEDRDERPSRTGSKGHAGRRRPPRYRQDLPPITDVVHEGDHVMVQVVREPAGGKGARVTTRISLPGRYVVLIPTGSAHVGVSRRIEAPAERARLRELARQVAPRGYGMIVRTEGEGCDLSDLREDVEHLRGVWRRIKDSYRRKTAPSLLHEDVSLVERMIRDTFSDDTTEIVLDSQAEYERALTALRAISKEAPKRCVLYRGDAPLFEARGVEREIERLHARRVPLPSGGNLTIDETEAVCTIDVNTGSFVGSTSHAETVLATNLEAAHEIARQLRLRDIGGIIVLDLIDMESAEHRRRVMEALEADLARDKARSRVVHISPLGIVEMTRKRTGQSLLQLTCRPCPQCEKRGWVPSAAYLAAKAERELGRRARGSRPEAFAVFVPFDVAWEMIGPEGQTVALTEESLGASVYVRCDPLLASDRFEIRQGRNVDIARDYHRWRKGQMFHCTPRKVMTDQNEAVAVAEVDGYLVIVEDWREQGDRLVTVELIEIGRSLGTGRVVE